MRIDNNPVQEKVSSTGPLVLPPVITAPVAPLTPLEPLTKPQFEAQKPHGDSDKDAPLDIQSAKSELTELIEQASPTMVQKNAHAIPKPSDIEDEQGAESHEVETEDRGSEILKEGLTLLKDKALSMLEHETEETETEDLESELLKKGAMVLTSKVIDLVHHDGAFDGEQLLDVVMDLGKLKGHSKTEDGPLDDDDDDDDTLAAQIAKIKPFDKDAYESGELRKKLDSRVAELIKKADHLANTLDLTAVTTGPDVAVLFSQFAEIAQQLSKDMYQILAKIHQSDKLDGEIFQKFADKLDSSNDYNTEMLGKLNRNSKLQLKLVMQMISGKLFQQMDAVHRAQTDNAHVPAALQMLNQLQVALHVI